MFGRICQESCAKSESSLLVILRCSGGVGRGTRPARTLQIKQQRAAIGRRPCRARGRVGHERTVRAAHRVGTEPACRCRRRVTQEAADAAEDVAAGEESTEHLIVQRVHPLAADLERMIAAHDRDVVFELRAPDQLVDAGLQEERIAEPEGRAEPRCRCRPQGPNRRPCVGGFRANR